VPFQWDMIPVFPSYRRFHGELVPKPDTSLLDLQTSEAEMLSQLDHRRFYRLDKVIVSSQLADGHTIQPVEVKAGHHYVWAIGTGETASVVAQSFISKEELEYVEKYLRYCLIMMGLPAEIIDNRSRAETGAAKEVDYGPIQKHEDADREQANEWAREFMAWCMPMLTSYGMLPDGQDVSVSSVPARRPKPKDLQSWVQGLTMGAEVGAIDLVREYSVANKVGLSQARKELLANAAFYRKLKAIAAGTPATETEDDGLQVDAEETELESA